MSTQKKKTTNMPHEFHEYAKLPKGWAITEVRDEEVEEVWEQQKQALSDSITPGRLTRSASRSLRVQCLPSPVDSK